MLDNDYMQHALEQAILGEKAGEVPIGAVVVYQGKIIATGYNQPITHQDPTAHAEIIALRNAAKVLNNYRLVDTALYVTLEPCAMCAAAMVHARIKRLVYGAADPKAGAVDSQIKLLDQPHFNHKVDYQGGVLTEPCGQVLKEFFKRKRGSINVSVE